MNMPTDLNSMHRRLVDKICADQEAKMTENIVRMQAMMVQAQQGYDCDLESLQFSGADVPALQRLEQNINAQAEQEFSDQDLFMQQTSMDSSIGEELNIETSLLPYGSKLITPSWCGTFSDSIAENNLVESSVLTPQQVIGGGSCKNIWNYAKGDGMGCTGGTASNTQTISWVFWFKPDESRFYSIKPKFQLHGYYIAKANNKWYNCKSCKIKISAQTDVHQYTWKGLSSEDMINISSQNVNLNRRLDDERYTNYSALLGKGDWVSVVCYVKLYVKAQGGGSYAKNDFSTGTNKICVPHIIVN